MRTFYRTILILLFAAVFASSGFAQTKPEYVAPFPPSPNRTAVLDFDGDGKTDIAVMRYDLDSAGSLTWWVRSSRTGEQMPVARFGGVSLGDYPPIVMDYDGDGKADFAVFRGSGSQNKNPLGVFYILQSATNTVLILQWGLRNDYARMTQDFDGDGKADPTVIRCDAQRRFQYWYILSSKSNYQQARVEQFGNCGTLTNDNPIRGDFDGDGKADLAFYRQFEANADGTRGAPSNRFYIKMSGKNRVQKIQFGDASTQSAYTGDFDGDGKTDLATGFNVSDGIYVRRWWQWIRSSDGGYEIHQWGFSGGPTDTIDGSALGDYDGDGRTDVAISRNKEPFTTDRRRWFYIRNSRDSSVTIIQWGLENDLIPAILSFN